MHVRLIFLVSFAFLTLILTSPLPNLKLKRSPLPSNGFAINDDGGIKVGDFGLTEDSSASLSDLDPVDEGLDKRSNGFGINADGGIKVGGFGLTQDSSDSSSDLDPTDSQTDSSSSSPDPDSVDNLKKRTTPTTPSTSGFQHSNPFTDWPDTHHVPDARSPSPTTSSSSSWVETEQEQHGYPNQYDEGWLDAHHEPESLSAPNSAFLSLLKS